MKTKKPTIKSLKYEIERLNQELITTRQLNDLLRKSELSLKQTIEQIKKETFHKERQDLARSYGQLLDAVGTGLRTILAPGSF